MSDICKYCKEPVYAAKLCRGHYKEAFAENRKGIGNRFNLK